MPLKFSDDVAKKLAEKHNVTQDEVQQCFANVEGKFLKDPREEHQTNPPTHWFIAETNRLRLLKVVFVASKVKTETGTETQIDIKTAYPPDANEIAIYDRYGR